MSTSESGKKPESEGYLSAYHGYATTLRTRLVGYGIGCPAIILTQEPLRKAIWAASWNGLLTLLFLAGVLSQVVLAVVNKSVNCHFYYHSYRKERGIPTAGTKTEETRLYRFSNWFPPLTLPWTRPRSSVLPYRRSGWPSCFSPPPGA
jgi:hypothetical protein